mmetsp:Transcript_14839/g.21402  ORF Transcript_14839/g.21402 Transcript_14839/m.21402 type:complete len:209 (+) Transcript_14839:236-862(+)
MITSNREWSSVSEPDPPHTSPSSGSEKNSNRENSRISSPSQLLSEPRNRRKNSGFLSSPSIPTPNSMLPSMGPMRSILILILPREAEERYSVKRLWRSVRRNLLLLLTNPKFATDSDPASPSRSRSFPSATNTPCAQSPNSHPAVGANPSSVWDPHRTTRSTETKSLSPITVTTSSICTLRNLSRMLQLWAKKSRMLSVLLNTDFSVI